MNIIKLYGLERSGTNYIKAIIEKNIINTRVLNNLYGRKHDPYIEPDLNIYNPRTDPRVQTDLTESELEIIHQKFKNKDVGYIILIKDPMSWMLSYNRGVHVSNFPTQSVPLSQDSIKKYMKKYNDTYLNWYNNLFLKKQDRTLFIQYGKLLTDYKSVLHKISDKFKIKLNKNTEDIKGYMTTGLDAAYYKNITNVPFNKQYYLNKEYLEYFSSSDIDLVTKCLDPKIIFLGVFDD